MNFSVFSGELPTNKLIPETILSQFPELANLKVSLNTYAKTYSLETPRFQELVIKYKLAKLSVKPISGAFLIDDNGAITLTIPDSANSPRVSSFLFKYRITGFKTDGENWIDIYTDRKTFSFGEKK